LLQTLSQLLPFPELLAEFLFFTKTILTRYLRMDEYQACLLELLSQAFIIQQHSYLVINGAARVVTFAVTSELFEKTKPTRPYCDTDFPIHKVLIDLFYEADARELAIPLMDKFYVMFYKQPPDCIPGLFAKIGNEFRRFVPKFKEGTLALIKSSVGLIQKLPITHLCALQRSDFFPSVEALIAGKSCTEDVLLDALTLLRFVVPDDCSLHWKRIDNIVAGITMTEELYAVLLSIISQQSTFQGIRNLQATVFFRTIIRSPFALTFMRELEAVVAPSIVQCFLAAELNVPGELMTNITSPELFDVILHFLTRVFAFDTSSSAFYTFFRLMTQEDDGKQSRFFDRLAPAFLCLIMQKDVRQQPFLFFGSCLGSLQIPVLSPTQFPTGFSLIFSVIFGRFQANDSIQLFSFHSQSNFFSAIIRKGRIEFSSSFYESSKPLTIDIDIPENRVLDLNLHFESFGNITLSINGTEAGTGSTPSKPWTDPFDEYTVFGGYQSGSVQCCLFKLTICDGEAHETARYNVGNRDWSELISEVNPDSDRARFNSPICASPTTFWQVFEKFNGVSIFLSVLPQVNCPGEIDPGPILSLMMQIVVSFLMRSETLQGQFFELHGFEIVADVLGETRGEALVSDLFRSLLQLSSMARNSELVGSFLRCIAFNFSIWRRASIETQSHVLESWIDLADSFPQAFQANVHPKMLLEIVYSFYETSEMTASLLAILLRLLQTSLQNRLDREEFGLIFGIISSRREFLPDVINWLDLINSVIVRSQPINAEIAATLLETQWLCHHDSPEIQSRLQLFFFAVDPLFSVRHILETAKHLAALEICVAPDLLVPPCAALVKLDCNSLEEIVRRSSEWALNCSMFPFAIIRAFYSSDELVAEFGRFLSTLVSVPACFAAIQMSISPLTLLILLSFIEVRAANCLDFLIALFASSEAIVFDSFRILDLLAMVTGHDFHSFQNKLAHLLKAVVFHSSFQGDRQPYLDFLIDFIAFRPKFPDGPKLDRDLATILRRLGQSTVRLPPYQYSFKIVSEQWLDLDLISELQLGLANFPELRVDRFLILFSFVFHRFVPPIDNPVAFLDECMSSVSEDSTCWSPVILQIARNPVDYDPPSKFFDRFKPRLRESDALYMAVDATLRAFSESWVLRSKSDELISTLLRSRLQSKPCAVAPVAESIRAIRHAAVALRREFHTRTDSLVHELHEANLVLRKESSDYQRSNRFDLRLRPIVLLRKVPISTKSRSSRSGQTRPAVTSLWSFPCDRIQPLGISAGTFAVTAEEFSFVGSAGKTVRIPAASVSHLFWGWSGHKADAVQIFTNDYAGFLFRFKGEKSEDVFRKLALAKLPSGIFCQSVRPQDELKELGLTQKWVDRKIGTAEYLLWLNLLSGRSFLEMRAYPVFPRLFMDDGTARDISGVCEPPFLDAGSVCQFLGGIDPFDGLTSVYTDRMAAPEWPADFFFLEEATEFVQRNKEALESDKFDISEWIDCLWGCKRSETTKKVSPVCLFQKPHPKRSPPASPGRSNIIELDGLADNIAALKITGKSATTAKVQAVFDDSRLWELRLDASRIEIPPKDTPPLYEYPVFTETSILFISGHSRRLGRLDLKTGEITTKRIDFQVSALACSDPHIVVGAKDGSVSFWRYSSKTFRLLKSMVCHSDRVISVVVNQALGIAASCSLDNSVCAVILPHYGLLRKFDLCFERGIVVAKLLITNSNGFIAIAVGNGKSVLSGLTLTGKLNQTKDYAREIRDGCAFSNAAGVDYVGIVNADGEVFLLDAFTLETKKVVFQRPLLRSLHYSALMNAFVIPGNNRSLSIVSL
jgi:hypothetical protein